MSDHIVDENLDGDIGLISRRDALKKAAVGGVIVWTAPMILSSPASAASCTLACAPTIDAQGLNVLSTDLCANDIAALSGYTGNANKVVLVQITPDPTVATCPCSESEPTVVLSGGPTEFSKGNDPGDLGSCDPFVDSPSNPSVLRYEDLSPADQVAFEADFDFGPDSFVVYKNGAMPNGWYTGNNPLCVSVGCPDEVGGDMVWRNCPYFICFEYSPEGSCGTLLEYGSRLTPAGDCTVACDAGC